MTAIFKVDASNHDWGRGPMDVAAMRRDGIDVFIHKATDGPHFYRDPYFGAAMSRARATAMPITGAYHVLWNGNVTDQVDWFIDTVVAAAPWAATEPYEWMWDCEPFGYNGATPTVATINAACDRLMQRLPNHRPLAYCPKWAYGSLAGLRCPVVASSYGNNPAVPYRQAYPGDGSGRWAAYGDIAAPVVLQFGSNTIVGGQHTVDANAFRGSLDELRALITGRQTTMALDQDPDGPYLIWRAEAIAHLLDTFQGGPEKGKEVELSRVIKRIDVNAAAAATAAGPTQEQVNTAVLAAMLDPRVQKGIGDAIASHLHVT